MEYLEGVADGSRSEISNFAADQNSSTLSKFQMARPQFLVRFVQQHPTFRVSELESCAVMSGCTAAHSLKFLEYDEAVPFAVVELENEQQAVALVDRSILTQ
jgi:hypothetical protein